jgi:hypothetical protein
VSSGHSDASSKIAKARLIRSMSIRFGEAGLAGC